MNKYFQGWEEFEVDGATVAFYKKTTQKELFIGFDSSSCTPPGPMVNAMVAFNFVTDKNTKVVMINHKFPAGLIPKIESQFDYEQEDLEDSLVKLTFTLKSGVKPKQFDTNQVCHG
ncbi:MAG: hypothetical protein GXZ15_01120 [Campylobacter sp.]|nr:hypothetical protein [Campylobacter sp.]